MGRWIDGKFNLYYDDIIFTYEAKVYDEDSIHGINGGKVLKLRIEQIPYPLESSDDTKVIAQYDRGEWLLEPKTKMAKDALEYVLDLYK